MSNNLFSSGDRLLVLTVGASCSGKTTWAEEFTLDQLSQGVNFCNLNRDDVRFRIHSNGVRDWRNYKFNKNNEKQVTDIIDELAKGCVDDGVNIIISDTNLNPKTQEKWQQWAKDNNYKVVYKYFDVEWEELVKRNSQRSGGIPEHILWNQHLKMKRTTSYIYSHDNTLEPCVICDIDGTVAKKAEERSFFDWDLVHLDEPRLEIIAMLDGLAMRNGNVVFMSGRDGSCYDKTYEWIEKYITSNWNDDISWKLVMRETKDSRKDYIVKEELYFDHVFEQYNVAAVLDDRPQVIRLWEQFNLPNIVNVGRYNHEF